jgi:hypothetical protein
MWTTTPAPASVSELGEPRAKRELMLAATLCGDAGSGGGGEDGAAGGLVGGAGAGTMGGGVCGGGEEAGDHGDGIDGGGSNVGGGSDGGECGQAGGPDKRSDAGGARGIIVS